jgi:hypothetical protein
VVLPHFSSLIQQDATQPCRFQQNACDTLNTVVEVQFLEIAELSEFSTIPIYVRQETVHLWHLLASPTQSTTLIYGPPGVGKSVVTWAWACYQSTSQTVLWIHIPRVVGQQFVLLQNAVAKCLILKSLFDLQDITANVLILDGLTEERKKDYALPVGNWQRKYNGRVVFVTSDRFKYYSEDSIKMDIFHATSWSWEELQKACDSKAFFEFVKPKLIPDDLMELDDNLKEEFLKQKFSLAGGSVRWMFGKTNEEVEIDLKNAIESCGNLENLLKGLQGFKSNIAVNHLLGRDEKGEHFIISRWVSYQIANKCDHAFLKYAMKHPLRNNNPSFDGWLFEVDFLHQLKEATGKTLNFPHAGVCWPVPRLIEFRDPIDFVGNVFQLPGLPEVYENKKKICEGDWLIPLRWNQPCFDAAQLCDQKLRFVQVTRANTHDLLLNRCHKLIKALVSIGFQISEIDFVIVVPLGEEKQFKHGQITGNLAEWGWTTKNLQILGLCRTQ